MAVIRRFTRDQSRLRKRRLRGSVIKSLRSRLIKTLILIIFVSLPFVAIFNSFRVKQAGCTNLPPNDQALVNPIIASVFDHRLLFSISQPEIKALFDDLYLWEVTEIKKQYPNTLHLTCQRLVNRYYLQQLKPPQTPPPLSLSDWLSWGRQIISASPTGTSLLIFQPQANRLTVVPSLNLPLETGYLFLTTQPVKLVADNLWRMYFWLKAYQPQPDRIFKVYVNQNISLIFDPQRQLFYLLDPNKLPEPANLHQFLDQAGSGLRLIDWRLNRLVVI